MERLTEKNDEHYIARQDRVNGKIIGNQMCLDKLGELEDAEEQGLLLRLPVPLGTTVYALVDECEEMYEPSSWYTTISEEKFDFYMIDVFGKEVFLTREEAEAALAEKGGAV